MIAITDTSNYRLPLPTSEGEFVAAYSSKGLCGLEFPAGGREPRLPPAGRCERPATGTEVPPQIRRWHTAAAKALASALSGQCPEDLPPLDFSSGTEFQQQVWRALRELAPGQTVSYSRLAELVGRPRAARAVGAACGANPIPVFVPCHRVLASNHGLGGFSAGLTWKRTLLAREARARW